MGAKGHRVLFLRVFRRVGDYDRSTSPLQLHVRLLPHPILCGSSERCQAHLSYLQDCSWSVQMLITNTAAATVLLYYTELS